MRCAPATGPVLLRLRVPRLSGHSGQDTQAYKSAGEIAAERARDPLLTLRGASFPARSGESRMAGARSRARKTKSGRALARIEARRRSHRLRRSRAIVFTEQRADGSLELQAQGGQRADGVTPPAGSATPRPEGARINMLTAIRRTLEHELAINPRVLVFGEDVGRKGGVHAVTLGLQERFGEERVFDTSLSEEGIIGRAVGMALAGLDAGAGDPVPQVRRAGRRADQRLRHDALAHRQPLRRADGGAHAGRLLQVRRSLAQPDATRCSSCHNPGWRLAVPSNAEDAVGLLRTALRGNDPVDLLRASRHARRRCGAPPLAGRRFRAAVRPGEDGCARAPSSPS